MPEFKRHELGGLFRPQVAKFAFLLKNRLRHGAKELAVPTRTQLGPVAVAIYVLMIVHQVGRIEVDVVDDPGRVFGKEEGWVVPDAMLDLGERCARNCELSLVAVVVGDAAHAQAWIRG